MHSKYSRSKSPLSASKVSAQNNARRSREPSTSEERYQSACALLQDFCNRTSSHGIPFIGQPAFFNRGVWTVITTLCFFSFLFQTYWTLSEYFQYRTIIEMQLKFEPAPFPAATVCNLNPFKHSELRRHEEISMGLDAWESQINKLNGELERTATRKKRDVKYLPVFVRCTCLNSEDHCVPQRNPLKVNTTVCVCFEDINTGNIWPCYPTSIWTEKKCYDCSISNTCDDPDRSNVTLQTRGNDLVNNNMNKFSNDISKIKSNGTVGEHSTAQRGTRCLCQSISNNCVIMQDDEIHWWNPNNFSIVPIVKSTKPPEIIESFGTTDLKDRGAITTKTKETLIFMVAALPKEVRKNLSYTLEEFVLRCSFNSEDCNMYRDFQLHMDPEYGNCYTFNFNDSVELKNSRAGPMYGLRLLLNVNQSDYMPTTEAAGVRLVVHEQDQEPFPDTFGYSAPTGFVSSFGLKTKILHRLDAPFGTCSDTYRPVGYIYEEHYSPEGCYRNCFQHMVLERCGCGDPRFPLPSDKERPCEARNKAERTCLANLTNQTGGFYHLGHDCHCVQPCTENVFETAYSASAWPAINFKIGDDCPAVIDITNDSKACTEYYRVNTAYIEIFYEQLNFETLRETAGYTLVNLFSDFGGNIGLWIGFSIITMMEIFELVCEMIYYMFYQRPMRMIRRRHRMHDAQLRMPHLRLRNEHNDMHTTFAKTYNASLTMDSNLNLDLSELGGDSLRE